MEGNNHLPGRAFLWFGVAVLDDARCSGVGGNTSTRDCFVGIYRLVTGTHANCGIDNVVARRAWLRAGVVVGLVLKTICDRTSRAALVLVLVILPRFVLALVTGFAVVADWDIPPLAVLNTLGIVRLVNGEAAVALRVAKGLVPHAHIPGTPVARAGCDAELWVRDNIFATANGVSAGQEVATGPTDVGAAHAWATQPLTGADSIQA